MKKQKGYTLLQVLVIVVVLGFLVLIANTKNDTDDDSEHLALLFPPEPTATEILEKAENVCLNGKEELQIRKDLIFGNDPEDTTISEILNSCELLMNSSAKTPLSSIEKNILATGINMRVKLSYHFAGGINALYPELQKGNGSKSKPLPPST